MIIKQLVEDTMKECTYLIGCEETGDAVIIDPAGDIEEMVDLANHHNLKIKYIFNSHHHYDHTRGNRKLKKITGAKTLIHGDDLKGLRNFFNLKKFIKYRYIVPPRPDIIINEDSDFKVGSLNFRIIHTPGHTMGSVCFLVENNLFTGDTLFVGRTGRVNFKDSDPFAMGASLRKILLSLPEETIIWAGHHYGPTKTSTIEKERRTNLHGEKYSFALEK